MSNDPNVSSDSSEQGGYIIDAENAEEMARLMILEQVLTQGELDSLQEQLEADLQKEDFCGIDYYHTVWGYKQG